jgi:hypothetical protein
MGISEAEIIQAMRTDAIITDAEVDEFFEHDRLHQVNQRNYESYASSRAGFYRHRQGPR